MHSQSNRCALNASPSACHLHRCIRLGGARGAGLTLRHAKRYLIADSPLTAISWWRLLLDEAQNVGDGFSQVGICTFWCVHTLPEGFKRAPPPQLSCIGTPWSI